MDPNDSKTAPGAYLGLTVVEDEKGVQIKEVDFDSPAEKSNLAGGMRLLKFNGQKMNSIKEFFNIMRTARPGQKIRLTVREMDAKPEVVTIRLSKLPKYSEEWFALKEELVEIRIQLDDK